MTGLVDINKEIEELLYDHDCVILPDFGGFVVVYQPAHFNKQKNSLFPPRKRASFNGRLKTSDGILANHISVKHQVPYSEASKLVSGKVKEFLSELKNSRRIDITGVGVLYLNKENNYRFLPDEDSNFLKDSFGLKQVHVNYRKEGIVEPSVAVASKNRGWKIAAAVFIPLFLAGGLFFGSQYKKGKVSLAGLNPFKQEVVVAEYSNRINKPEAVTTEQEVDLEEYVAQNPNQETVRYSFVEEVISENGVLVKIRDINEFPEEKEMDEVSKETATNQFRAPGWYIVGGAFAEPENAEKMVAGLQGKGYNSFVFDKKGQLNLVCYGRYDQESKAREELKKIRSTESRSAWLKKLK